MSLPAPLSIIILKSVKNTKDTMAKAIIYSSGESLFQQSPRHSFSNLISDETKKPYNDYDTKAKDIELHIIAYENVSILVKIHILNIISSYFTDLFIFTPIIQ